ncbi:alpha-(1,3)-fucosyltransferase fut-6-like isoform X2 [Mercenaria mercenaria]|uniref:alpha-(1,3)-fucosyltransferase fut-6-like isoform X2 n=1 Tax=Mercenaria mercenaria TaxID=6596 RepID=UPI00234E525C|nr:alpha-(1,3)-fucosyltransferase fut-6-like isoform X2 [Mercenaria mercenaria]
MVKSTYLTCARRLCLILVIITIFLITFVNIQFNMKGYWLVPAHVSSTFESVKRLMRNRVSDQTVKQNQNRTLINVFEGVRNKDIGVRNKDKGVRNKDKGGQNKDKTTNITGLIPNENAMRHILWYNKPVWIHLGFANRVLASECVYNNCRMSDSKTDLQKYAAIVFTFTQELDFTPPVSKGERNIDQVWIFFGLESPVYHKRIAYRHNSWMNTMNWSMSYRLDADIFFPYGMLERKKEIQQRNFSAIFQRKTKQAVWLVSNCGAVSKRDDFVSELQRSGVEVDIFGVCTDNLFHDKNDMLSRINKDYKFYFSFENSLCQDYVTEKFFRYYNLDVVLVVRGGVDYDHALPNETFINAAHFESAKALARFLFKVGSSEKLYTNFIRNKDRYVASEMFTMPSSYCSICEKLNNLNDYRKSYDDHVTYIHENTCWEASDVPFRLTGLMSDLMIAILFLLFIIMCYFVVRKHLSSCNSGCGTTRTLLLKICLGKK